MVHFDAAGISVSLGQRRDDDLGDGEVGVVGERRGRLDRCRQFWKRLLIVRLLSSRYLSRSESMQQKVEIRLVCDQCRRRT